MDFMVDNAQLGFLGEYESLGGYTSRVWVAEANSGSLFISV